MFELYDKYFFGNEITKLSKEMNCMWVICWNNKCTSTAGRQSCKVDTCKTITLELSSKVFKKSIKMMNDDGRQFIKLDQNNKCNSILSCLMFIFEHELVHGLQNCLCPPWMYGKKGPGTWSGKTRPGNGHSKTFMSILNNTFGHMNFTHSLLTHAKKEVKEDKVGEEGLGDALERVQIEQLQDVTKKKPDKGKDKKRDKDKDKEKKLTKLGKEWVEAASEEMKKNEGIIKITKSNKTREENQKGNGIDEKMNFF